jgi:predicted oxidoreductase
MKTYFIPKTNLEVSRISYGCQKLVSIEEKSKAVKVISTAIEQGITLFDNANVYGGGKSEDIFGEALREMPGLRDKIVVQSKCGIRRPGDPNPDAVNRYDFSSEHIIQSVEGSLRRLKSDHLDILLLHRPDPLIEPEDVAKAFSELHGTGKVRHFGVSNHTAGQIALMEQYVEQPIVINQVQLSLVHSHLINDGIIFNREGVVYHAADGTLDYCRLNDIMVQAWAPVANGKLFNRPQDAPPDVARVCETIAKLADEKQTTKEAIAIAWLLRHPARIQPIIGTTNPDRVTASCLADSIELSREEWYELFAAARNIRVP